MLLLGDWALSSEFWAAFWGAITAGGITLWMTARERRFGRIQRLVEAYHNFVLQEGALWSAEVELAAATSLVSKGGTLHSVHAGAVQTWTEEHNLAVQKQAVITALDPGLPARVRASGEIVRKSFETREALDRGEGPDPAQRERDRNVDVEQLLSEIRLLSAHLPSVGGNALARWRAARRVARWRAQEEFLVKIGSLKTPKP